MKTTKAKISYKNKIFKILLKFESLNIIKIFSLKITLKMPNEI